MAPFPFLRLIPVLAGLALATAGWSMDAPKKELSDNVSSELGKLRTLTEAKNYDGAIQFLDNLLVTAAPDSYDLALLTQIKVQILLTEGKYNAAVPPLSRALELGERLGFFESGTLLDQRYLLSQLYYQQASETKDAAARAALLNQAYASISRWLERSPAPTPEVLLYAASILYTQATLDGTKVDPVKLRQAHAEAEKSLYLQLKPGDQAYVLMLAIRQQLGELPRTAEILEILVERHPDSATYWQQLAATYFALAAETKDEQRAGSYNLRAILTLERAQEQGLLTNPKENFSIVALYLTLQQFDRAIPLLQTGLQTGGIENTRRNWELLSSAYQQSHQDARALETLKQAVQTLPLDGQLEFSLAQLHYVLGRIDEARLHLESALSKDSIEKPGQARLFLAYVDYELKRFDDAGKWTREAALHPDAKPEDIERLSRAIKEALRDRADASKT
jgi:predicted Zn-dependent protease